MTSFDLSVRFFLQLAFILGACRVVGLLAQRVGQSQVVSEMITGVLLGPSLLGLLLPDAQAYFFPKESMPILYAVSQVGLALYMFLVGLEFQVDLIRRRMRSALSVSLAGIVVPFFLGGVIATLLAGDGCTAASAPRRATRRRIRPELPHPQRRVTLHLPGNAGAQCGVAATACERPVRADRARGLAVAPWHRMNVVHASSWPERHAARRTRT